MHAVRTSSSSGGAISVVVVARSQAQAVYEELEADARRGVDERALVDLAEPLVHLLELAGRGARRARRRGCPGLGPRSRCPGRSPLRAGPRRRVPRDDRSGRAPRGSPASPEARYPIPARGLQARSDSATLPPTAQSGFPSSTSPRSLRRSRGTRRSRGSRSSTSGAETRRSGRLSTSSTRSRLTRTSRRLTGTRRFADYLLCARRLRLGTPSSTASSSIRTPR